MILHVPLLQLLITCDEGAPPQQNQLWQDVLMRSFFDNISVEGIRHIHSSLEGADFCDGWDGIKCEKDKVTLVQYNEYRYGNFRLHWLPSSVQILLIEKCGQQYTVDTRNLPQCATRISLNENFIFGTFDLTTLPDKLEELYLLSNELKGPIALTHLPHSFRKLNLSGNRINQRTVWYGNLPPGIQRMVLRKGLESNRIKEVRSLDPDRPIQNKFVFFDSFRPENIH